MKKKRLLSLIMSAVMMLSISGMSASAIGNKDFATTSHYSSVERKKVEEAPTVPKAFNWNNIEKGKTYNLDSKAIRLDLKKTSMANDSLVSGKVAKTDKGYEFTVRGRSVFHDFGIINGSGLPTKVTVYYYDNGVLTPIDAAISDVIKENNVNEVDITFTIPESGMGAKPYGAADSYENMIKVSMKTTLSDKFLGTLFPGMVTPTFFYAFNVINNG